MTRIVKFPLNAIINIPPRALLALVAALLLLSSTGCRTTCDGRTESEICPIHNVMMETHVTKNEKTTPVLTPDYLYAEHYLFPHSYPAVLPDKCKTCVIYLCSDCVRAEQVWRTQHGMPLVERH